MDSERGAGTTFLTYLPLVDAQTGVSSQEELEDRPSVEGNETILLAEDDAVVRELNELALKSAGYAVIAAVDGEDAVRRFAENPERVDLLVFDVVMPKKDGMKAFEEIRKLRPGVKVLFMSGYAKDIALRKGVPEDGHYFLTKPFKPLKFLRSVREILDS